MAERQIHPNPFNVTKAVDFSDEQIAATWVDFREEQGFLSLADPKSPMPRILLGGKGSGRTHLMRYYSAALQRLRARGDSEAVLQEGYLGIYFRCSGLNAGRFQGKGVGNEMWDDVFAYYMDLWLAQLSLSTVMTAFRGYGPLVETNSRIASDIVRTFDELPGTPPADISAVLGLLRDLQRELDTAINNAALARDLPGLVIRTRRGVLPFTVPRSVAENVPALANITWLYLLDELENLTEAQQRYVHTLIREKERPASFMVGSRLYGFRTRRTYSGDEENKEGSEFEALQLDRFYLDHFSEFDRFCRHLVAQRLIEEGYSGEDRQGLADRLDAFFDIPVQGDTSFVEGTGLERKYLRKLHRELVRAGKLDELEATSVTHALQVDDEPLLEKLNVLLLYQAWANGKDLSQEAEAISEMSRRHRGGDVNGPYVQKLRHHRSDLHAQLLRQYDLKQRYVGMDDFIRMAGGLPRNLLIILKNVVRWSEFNGERAFTAGRISVESQRRGVLEASSWFLKDSLAMGDMGERVENAVLRLGGLLRAVRFSDKPPEIKPAAFTVDVPNLGSEARDTMRVAQQWSLILPLAPQRDRNLSTLVDKYRINPMLSPTFDLPVSLGGALRLSGAECDAVFGERGAERYEAVVRSWVSRASVPFRTVNGQKSLLD